MLIGGNFTSVMVFSPIFSTISVAMKLAAPWGKGLDLTDHDDGLKCCCPFGFICCLIIPLTIIMIVFFGQTAV